MKRLSTDKTLSPYAAQFVPVKLDIGSSAYRTWRKDLDLTGKVKRYPYLFIVRSDGETIYGDGGLTARTKLIPLMESALQASGRSLNAREAKTLSEVAERFVDLNDSGDMAGAIKAINKASRVGIPGQIPSYAQSAMKINELVQDMATEVMAKLEELESKIESSESDERVEAVLESMKLTRDCGSLKVLRPEFNKFKRKLSKNKELSQILKEAKIINTAIEASSTTAKKRAAERLQQLIDKTEIEKIKSEAQSVLDNLDLQE